MTFKKIGYGWDDQLHARVYIYNYIYIIIFK